MRLLHPLQVVELPKNDPRPSLELFRGGHAVAEARAALFHFLLLEGRCLFRSLLIAPTLLYTPLSFLLPILSCTLTP